MARSFLSWLPPSGFGIGLRRVALIREPSIPASTSLEAGGAAQLIPPETVLRNGRAALWVGSFERGEALDAVAVDFGSDYPRLPTFPRVGIDPTTGEADIQGRMYLAVQVPPKPLALVPEASDFLGGMVLGSVGLDGRGAFARGFRDCGGLSSSSASAFVSSAASPTGPWPTLCSPPPGLAALLIADAPLFREGPSSRRLDALTLRFGLPLQGPLLLAPSRASSASPSGL